MEYICQKCNSKNTYIKIYKANVKVKNKNIEVANKRRFCNECNSLVYDQKLDNEFSKEAIRKYNELYGLPAQNIKNFRKKLNLSVEDFAKIIGCAKKTMISYENENSIPNDVYLVIIKTIIDNPEIIKNIIDSTKERFTEKEYGKIKSKITVGLSNNFNIIGDF